eukprot:TRINITY_DN6896_c0_g2_i1.p1 TRINITY_DN6896_c0_g2~~TRINITY_DN6896_c0_g2_i1.p1  ORF type:complete len:844 (-),score=245.97 TRINITY_DN6896_c0_g2_i1:55-2433(-)
MQTMELLFGGAELEVLKEGWLQRDEDGVWRKRWVKITLRELLFAKMKSSEPLKVYRTDTVKEIAFGTEIGANRPSASQDNAFSFTTAEGVEYFCAGSLEERNGWTQFLRDIVPKAKMVATYEMLKEKARAQAMLEFLERQRVDAQNTILSGRENVCLFPNFRAYANMLNGHLDLLKSEVDSVEVIAMNAAKPIADALVKVVDASNSSVAVCRNDESTQESILTLTRSICGEASHVLQFGRTAARDEGDKDSMLAHMGSTRDLIDQLKLLLKNISDEQEMVLQQCQFQDAAASLITNVKSKTKKAATQSTSQFATTVLGSDVLENAYALKDKLAQLAKDVDRVDNAERAGVDGDKRNAGQTLEKHAIEAAVKMCDMVEINKAILKMPVVADTPDTMSLFLSTTRNLGAATTDLMAALRDAGEGGISIDDAIRNADLSIQTYLEAAKESAIIDDTSRPAVKEGWTSHRRVLSDGNAGGFFGHSRNVSVGSAPTSAPTSGASSPAIAHVPIAAPPARPPRPNEGDASGVPPPRPSRPPAGIVEAEEQSKRDVQEALLGSLKRVEETTQRLKRATARVDLADLDLDAMTAAEEAGDSGAPGAEVPDDVVSNANAITESSASLLRAVMAAHDEAAAANSSNVDDFWSHRSAWLLPAAESVADFTKKLSDVAINRERSDDVEQGLVAAVRCLKAATAKLTTASKTQLEIDSPASRQLTDASASINATIQRLVDAVRSNEEVKARRRMAREEKKISHKLSQIREFECQKRIATLEKQLNDSRKELQRLRGTSSSGGGHA